MVGVRGWVGGLAKAAAERKDFRPGLSAVEGLSPNGFFANAERRYGASDAHKVLASRR